MVTNAHPDAERLALYVDGTLPPADRLAIEEHLGECQDCRDVVAETVAFEAADSAQPRRLPFRQRWVTATAATLAAAAAVVIAIRLAQPEWLATSPRTDRPELQELVAALANEPTRPMDGRLSGGFQYAPPPSPTRGPGDRQLSPDVRIAVAKIEQSARESASPANRAALGAAYLAAGNANKAIEVLEQATTDAPIAWNDLSVAYMGRQESGDPMRAVDAARRAGDAMPGAPAAQFNYALALERLQLLPEARNAWRAYLALDGVSPWAAEAQRRLEAIDKRP